MRIFSLSQIPSFQSASAELWAAIAATIGLLTWSAKKLFARRQPPKPEYITRAEFHQQLTVLRDRIGASYLAMADKLDANHKDLKAALERLTLASEQRLDQLETALARVDERTRLKRSPRS